MFFQVEDDGAEARRGCPGGRFGHGMGDAAHLSLFADAGGICDELRSSPGDTGRRLSALQASGAAAGAWQLCAGDHGGDRESDADPDCPVSLFKLRADDQLPALVRPELSPGANRDGRGVPRRPMGSAGRSGVGRFAAPVSAADIGPRFGVMAGDQRRDWAVPGAAAGVDPVAVSEGGVWQLGGCHTPTGDAVQDYPLRSLPVPSTGRSGINHRVRIDGEGGVGPRSHTTKL